MIKSGKFQEDKRLEYSSVQKALQLLLSFIPDNELVGNLQLSEKLGLNKSTVSRLMQVLIHYGLIQQDSVTKKYELGKTAAMLGMAVEAWQSKHIAEIAQPYVDKLRDEVFESISVEMLSSSRSIVVAKAPGPPPLSVSHPEYLPVHVSAGAKAILAYSDESFVDSMIVSGLKRYTENTITDTAIFKRHLEDIRQRGIAYDMEEANDEVHAMGAPIFNHMKKAVAAICVCVPKSRLKRLQDEKTMRLLLDTARQISNRLFYPGDGNGL